MRAFIVRPFGTKNGIDFDRVEADLIAPALDRLEIFGRTTGEIVHQGNIRTDMFELLLTADLVVADMSIHNANVYYELGIRHAFRAKRTFLIRSRGDDVPFDLRTDRYFSYDAESPSASLDDLAQALKETLASDLPDSPIFLLLPELEEQQTDDFFAVPMEFGEEAEAARRAKDRGRLALIGHEARGFKWEKMGLRSVGEAQFKLAAWYAARMTWERVREIDPDDLRANLSLATIYRSLGDQTLSDQAIERVLEDSRSTAAQLAECYALRGANNKQLWHRDWAALEGGDRSRAALESAFLERALEAYELGFRHDLDHFYSGINALALLGVRLALAEQFPDVWSGQFESQERADFELASAKKQFDRLAATVGMSLAAARTRGEVDSWQEISEADLALLSSDRPSWVQSRYRRALAGATAQAGSSVRRQLALYRDLGVLQDNVEAVMKVLADAPGSGSRAEPRAPDEEPARVLLFTGHRIDAPGRESPRFPAAAEDKARSMVLEAVKAERDGAGGRVIGLAGAASGGDILFHEACRELGIESEIYLAAPRDGYVRASVQDSASDWVQRFDALSAELPTHVLSDRLETPRWLASRPGYSIWERCNMWMLHSALAHGSDKLVLIALWNGEGGDGPGGTQHMVESVREHGGRAEVLDAGELLATPDRQPD